LWVYTSVHFRSRAVPITISIDILSNAVSGVFVRTIVIEVSIDNFGTPYILLYFQFQTWPKIVITDSFVSSCYIFIISDEIWFLAIILFQSNISNMVTPLLHYLNEGIVKRFSQEFLYSGLRHCPHLFWKWIVRKFNSRVTS